MATGELTVEYEGKRVTFQSADDLLKRLAYAKQQLAAADPAADVTRRRVSYLAHNRG